ncbi:MAG: hypothetical protein D6729_12240, partial [Deltaproteobacteria bacterium]
MLVYDRPGMSDPHHGPAPPSTYLEDPTDQGALELVRSRLEAESDFPGLADLLADAGRRHPDAPEGAGLLAEAALLARTRLGDDARARALAEEALERDGGRVEALLILGELARSRGDDAAVARIHLRLGEVCTDWVSRAQNFALAGDAYEARLGDLAAAHRAWVAAIRAIPPSAAAGPDARALLVDSRRAPRLRAHFEAALEAAADDAQRAEALLVLGRLAVADPNRREEGVRLLLQAATLSDAAGALALEILGGLHALSEGWGAILEAMESDAASRDDDPRAAARILRQLAAACLAEPPLLSRAEKTLRRVLALEPDDVQSMETLVAVLTAAGRHREVIDLLEDLARVARPEVASLYLVRAGVTWLARFADRQASVSCFERALAADPSLDAARVHLKEAYQSLGRWQDLARLMLEEADARPAEEALETWRAAGRLLLEKAGDVSGAAAAYARITAHDPMDEDAIRFFQLFHRRIEVETRTIDAEEARAKDSEDPATQVQALVAAGEAAVRLGSPPRARHFLEMARSLAPDDAALRDRYVELLLGWGDPEAAERVLEADLQRLGPAHPDWPAVTLRLVELKLDRKGDVEGARRLLEDLEARDPAVADLARRRLAQIDAALARGRREAEIGWAPERLRAKLPGLHRPRQDAAARVAAAREAMEAGHFETAFDLANAAAQEVDATEPAGQDARELAANLLIDHLSDTEEGLDRLAELGRDRRLPVALRRRVNEARVRILERDVAPGAARDRALVEALEDAAAVAESPERARALRYRMARLLGERSETWRRAVAELEALLEDEPDSAAILEALAEIFEREGQAARLCEVLARRSELQDDDAAAATLARAADIAWDDLDDPELGLRYLRRGLERAPDDLALLKMLVRLARAAGDREAEVAALRQRIARETDHAALAALHYALAEALEALGRSEEAAAVFARTLELAPKSVAAIVGLARSAGALSDAEARAGFLRLCAEHHPNPRDGAALEVAGARVLFEEVGDTEAAHAAVMRALERDPENLDALGLLRAVRRREGASPQELATLLEREIEAAHSDRDAADLLAELASLHRERLDDSAGAVALWQRALGRVRDHAPSLAGLASAHLEAGRGEEARPLLEALADAVEAPAAARAWAKVQLAEVQERAGDYVAALEAYRAAAHLDPEDPTAVEGRARLAAKLGEDEEAARALEALAALGERGVTGAPAGGALADVYARLGATRRRLGDTSGAIAAYRQALARDAVHREALRTLAILHEVRGEWTEAAEMRERAAGLISDPLLRAGTLASVGAFLRDQAGDARRALDLFRQAAALAPDVLAHHSAVLALARRLGRTEEARSAAVECARLAPDARAAGDYLAAAAECADAEGEPEEALALARAALERHPGCQAALERVLPALEARGEHATAIEILERAAAAEHDPQQRSRWILERVRLLEDSGAGEAAARLLVEALDEAPDDAGLHLAVAGGADPEAAVAGEAAEKLWRRLSQAPLEVPVLLAAEKLTRAAGQRWRSLLAAALLEAL